MEIYKNVLTKMYNVYIVCTPKFDAFSKSLFPLLTIMECYKTKR